MLLSADGADPRLAHHDLMRVRIGASEDERPLHGRGEPLEVDAERDEVGRVYVPISQDLRYVSCSVVSSSISMPIARSFNRATSWSISAGTG